MQAGRAGSRDRDRNDSCTSLSTTSEDHPAPEGQAIQASHAHLQRHEPEAESRTHAASASKNDHQPLSSNANPSKPSLAHKAALRRLKGGSATPITSSAIPETAPSSGSGSLEPVLVRAYSHPTPESSSSKAGAMKSSNRATRPGTASCDLPRLESFSFQEILASIDSEVKVDIDAIAEICSRSKLSLASEYGSHLPPQAELLQRRGRTDILDAVPEQQQQQQQQEQQRPHHETALESLYLHSEIPQPQGPRQQNPIGMALMISMHQRKAPVTSVPVASTCKVSTHKAPAPSVTTPRPEPQQSLLPHLLSWLRRSAGSIAVADGSASTAEDSLQMILNDFKELTPPAG